MRGVRGSLATAFTRSVKDPFWDPFGRSSRSGSCSSGAVSANSIESTMFVNDVRSARYSPSVDGLPK